MLKREPAWRRSGPTLPPGAITAEDLSVLIHVRRLVAWKRVKVRPRATVRS